MELYTEIKHNDKEISWEAPVRYWEPKGKLWFLNYSLFFLLIMSVGAVLGQYLFILLIVAFAAMWFLQASVKPERHKVKITDKGVQAFNIIFPWSKIRYFWATNKNNVHYIHFDLGSNRFENINQSQIFFIVPEEIYLEVVDELIKKAEYGLKSEIQFGFLSTLLYGEYIPLGNFIKESEDDT